MNYRILVCLLLILLMVGIASADTLLVYTSGTSDGFLGPNGFPNLTYSQLRGTASNYNDKTGTTSRVYIYANATGSGKWQTLMRGYIEFNTSALPDDATINSAIVGLYGTGTTTHYAGYPLYGITRFNPATNGTVANGDFLTTSDDYLSDTKINNSEWSTTSYNNFTLNAAGLANVSKTGWTNYAWRDSWDVLNDTTGLTWDGSTTVLAYIRTAEATTNKPFIEVTYTTTVAPVASFSCTRNFVRIPNSITCTDSSTNTPTSWSWNMGDGSAAKTTQNVTYQYTKRGVWGITLNATNAGGSNVTPSATNVKVVGYENYY
jgi:hypothetical protein